MGYVIWPDGDRGDWVREIYDECRRAQEIFGSFKNSHEGHSVIREEFDEFWEEIKKKDADLAKIKKEAVQLGAMVLRFLVEVKEVNSKSRNNDA